MKPISSVLLKIFTLFFSFCFFSCTRSSNGYAPSTPNTEVLVPSQLITEVSQSQKTKLSSGWTFDADISATIQNQTLSNGWKIEVIYE